MLWMLARKLKGRSTRKRVAKAETADAADTATLEVPATAPADTPSPAPSPSREIEVGFDEIRRKVNEEVERNPEAAADILRRWLAEGPAAGNGTAAPAAAAEGSH
jgi:flagellar biosynthesis/type III secretory pathway M-ring protein FliF/YscJ